MTPHKIECYQPQPGQAEITFSLEPEMFWFKGHFAVQPLLPGVAQLDWVMHFPRCCSRRVFTSTVFRTSNFRRRCCRKIE